jgi:UDP-N-acetyl-D-glucosamine dehydrogenase
VTLDDPTVAAYDAVLIATDHDAVDYAVLDRAARLVVDTRNIMTKNGLDSGRVVKA